MSWRSGEAPQYGAIFMSNKLTKKECFARKLLGLPLAQASFVTQVQAGMILFLFEFEKRELHGVFRAVSDGAINIVPLAYTSSGKHFPAQVRFEQVWHCFPLREHEFRDAIRENYFSKSKFNFGLSDIQVRRLLVLFSSRKIKDDLRPMRSPLREVPPAIDSADEPRNEDPDNSVKLQNDGRLGMITSRYLADYPSDFTSSSGGLIGDNCSPNAAVVNTHSVDNEVGSLILDKQIGNFLGEIRRSIDGRAGISEAAGNERNMNLQAQLPYATDPTSTDHSHFASGYGIGNADDDGMYVPSYIPNLPSLYVPYVPEHKATPPSSNLLNSVLRPSFTSCEAVYPDRANMLSSEPTCSGLEVRKTFGGENHWDIALDSISFSEDLSSHTANNGNKYLSSSNKDHSLSLDNNYLDPSINQNAHLYSDRKYRVSVFDRLALPSGKSKSSDAIGTRNDECYLGSSVDEIMDALHQNHYRWTETGAYGSVNYLRNRGIKRRKILNSKVLNDPEEKESKEVDVPVNDVADHERSQLATTEETHFLDFKRRSKMQNTHDDAANVDSDDLSPGQHKKRKLIRPKFQRLESHDGTNLGYLSLESTQESQNFESLGNAKVDDRKGTPEKTDVLDVSSVSRTSELKNADEILSLGIIPELPTCGSVRNGEKDGKEEESDKNDVPNYIGDPNPDNQSSLENSEAGKLTQLGKYACYTILQELTSVLSRGERSESGLEIIGGRNHDADDSERLG